MEVSTIGLDIAKSVFQVHGVDESGATVIRRQVRRRHLLGFFEKQAPCLVGMEACATSHYWARQIAALGHEVRLMPPHYVKPYVKRNKNDMADAEAICEAVTRPTMRFVAPKSEEQQSVLVLHRSRELLVKQRTMLANAIRAHMAEFGIVAPRGIPRVKELLAVIADPDDERGWCRDRAQLAVRSAWAVSPSKAINTYDGCSSPGRCRSSRAPNDGRQRSGPGWTS